MIIFKGGDIRKTLLILFLSVFYSQPEVDNFTYMGNFDDHEYYISNSGGNYVNGIQICADAGGHLVTITSQEENDFVLNALMEYGGSSNHLWLGLDDLNGDGIYNWVTGESLNYTNWANGPSPGKATEMQTPSGTWVAIDPSETSNYRRYMLEISDCDLGDIDECGVCDGGGIADGECDCAGNIADCTDECGGTAELDECGECGGDGIDGYCHSVSECAGLDFEECLAYYFSDTQHCEWEGVCGCDGNVPDCSNVCGGSGILDGDGICCETGIVDECGVCGGDGIAEGSCDCSGNVLDECGVCGGDNSTCSDCAGTPNGNAELDGCGVCNGGNADDLGCGCFEPAPSGCDNACGSTFIIL